MKTPVLPSLSIRQMLLIVTGGLTLIIAGLSLRDLYTSAHRLDQVSQLRQAAALSDLLFNASDKVSVERDLALSMLNAPDEDAITELQGRLSESRAAADQAVSLAIAGLNKYDFTELTELRGKIETRHEDIVRLRARIDHAITLPRRQRERTLPALWSSASTGLMSETETLWARFISHFSSIDVIVWQHLRYRSFLRTINDYAGRERSIIGQIIVENTDPSPDQIADLLRGEGKLDLSWSTAQLLAEQSGLYPQIAPYFTDAKSHFDTMEDMSRAMFYPPGAHHAGSYLIGPDLWFELTDQSADSLQALRAASRTATNTYLDGLMAQTQRTIALQIAMFVFAVMLCVLSFWIVLARVVRPINDMVDALWRATRGEIVDFTPRAHINDEIGKLTTVLQVFQQTGQEIRRTASELQRSETRLRAVLDHAMDGVMTLDSDNIITSFNPACERIFGYSAPEAIGANIQLLTPALYAEEDLSHFIASAAAQQEGETGHEVTGQRKDGSSFPLDVTVSTFLIEGQTHYSVVLRDITLRKRAEQRLLGYTHALERSNKELDDFAYIASHDLKEPLRGIHNHSRFLLEDNTEKLDEESVGRLNRLIYLSQRMERLVNDLLYFSRLGRQELAIQRTDLGAVIRDIESTLDHFLEEKNAKIVMPRELPTIVCDKPRVSELFRNLMTNAVKYNDRDQKTVEIGFLECAPGPNGADMRNVFYVKDDGCGIDREFHQEIFRIFKRLKGSKEEGTGVGLTFVKKIVERHGGQIWLDSDVGHGATFYFTLEEAGDDAKHSARAA